ncbi:MAG: hypothetical protein QW341_03905 [Candidatus Bathyarchaeia archaeon]
MWLTVTEFDYVRGRASFLRPRGVKVDLLTENRKPILYGDNKEARSIKGIESFSVARGMLVHEGPEEALKVLREERFFAEARGFYCWAFTPSDLRSLFEKKGLEVVKIVGKTMAYVSRPETESLLQDKEKAETPGA